MTAHIIISGIAVVVLLISTLRGKALKHRALEITLRFFYLVTLISGTVMNMAHIHSAISIVHIAIAFFALYVLTIGLKIANK